MDHILVVEDESDIRDMLTDAISAEGYAIVAAATADDAMELISVPGLHLLVTDINLPGRLDGIELAFAAREVHPGLPVIFISGRHWRLADAEKVGNPATFLRKPFSLRALMVDVERFMASA